MLIYMALYLNKAKSRLSFILRETFEYMNDELRLFREFHLFTKKFHHKIYIVIADILVQLLIRRFISYKGRR